MCITVEWASAVPVTYIRRPSLGKLLISTSELRHGGGKRSLTGRASPPSNVEWKARVQTNTNHDRDHPPEQKNIKCSNIFFIWSAVIFFFCDTSGEWAPRGAFCWHTGSVRHRTPKEHHRFSPYDRTRYVTSRASISIVAISTRRVFSSSAFKAGSVYVQVPFCDCVLIWYFNRTIFAIDRGKLIVFTVLRSSERTWNK